MKQLLLELTSAGSYPVFAYKSPLRPSASVTRFDILEMLFPRQRFWKTTGGQKDALRGHLTVSGDANLLSHSRDPKRTYPMTEASVLR